jgi:starch synthase
MALRIPGVLNGIDMAEWNPEADAKIYQNYAMKNLKEGKTANKLALQKELSLAERPEVLA